MEKGGPDRKTSRATIVVLGGTGDTGRRLARRVVSSTTEVILTTRSPEDADWDPPDGTRIAQWDPTETDFGDFLATLERPVDVVINLIGAWLVGARHALVEITTDVVSALGSGARYVHCSAVSVWGSRPGEVVDETCPPFAEQRVARLHLEAEAVINEAIEGGLDGVILRLPHIYGPGRERTVTLMRNGRFVILGDGRNRMHHLHVDDFVETLAAVATADEVPSQLYAVVDDDDGTYGDYCDFVTASTGAIPLPFMSLTAALNGSLTDVLGPHFSDPKVVQEFWRFMTSDLRIDNSKMKNELGVELRYPTYREGLPTVLDTESTDTRQTQQMETAVIDQEFEVWTRVLEARPELDAARGENEPMHAEAGGASMRVSAFESDQIRWGRLARLASERMNNLNVIFFPRVDVDAPILGLEIVFNDDGHSFSAFDVVGTTDPEWIALLDAARKSPGLDGQTVPVEGRLAALLTPHAVVVRGPDVANSELFGAARSILLAYLEKIAEAPGRPPMEGESGQRAYCRKWAQRPGGVDLLGRLFGSDWSERFIDQVYYPEP